MKETSLANFINIILNDLLSYIASFGTNELKSGYDN